ncbi:hypothetical protein Poly30_01670 [Planctomycetes bacterium Poly30]|uniref:3-keto-alpha-glucoside-1,2-lyase/3-keto-2-hydroxy-glucal hydratase domain-containing protein n=1 Tax=Saltatorellus ferox TaxID=2528018 RepID=A0A518EKQ3_9BACT|nr:hypothetical protein Poly30_01670 [Planctomycetes bacterium Poly30]
MTQLLLGRLMARPEAQITLLAGTAILSFALGVRPTTSLADQEGAPAAAPIEADEAEWVALFNGKDLEGWTPKFAGQKAGENYLDTFRVEDGLLRVVYDGYGDFGAKFGHLFFKEPFSSYDLRVVYRFREGQVKGGPGWAFRNNGVMLHGQTPESMDVDQDFPASIEAQLLGQNTGGGERSNANLCTPSTNVEIGGEVKLDHCIQSGGPTSYGEDWVTFEVQVRGNRVIRHYVNGEKVMEYQRPQLDPRDPYAKKLIEGGAEIQLSSGTISIQAESHPIDFKSIEIHVVEKDAE